MITLSSKTHEEIVSLSADFSAVLAAGEVIQSATIVVSVLRGVDPSVGSMAIGAVSIAGPVVSRLIGAGVTDVDYLVTATATTDAGQVLKVTGILPVRVQT